MKGVLLAGGTGSRLAPLTNVTNKHLLPVFNKPMIFYPLLTMREAGITEVLIVSGRGHAGHFLELLGSGKQFGMKFSYEIQEEAGGIAQALSLASNFVGEDKFLTILGDNVVEDDISDDVTAFENSDSSAQIFLKEVSNPSSYGVATLEDGKITEIVEKPNNPTSNFAVVGLYFYNSTVFDFISRLSPSQRGELEITDVNNSYLADDKLDYVVLDGFWGDCGESFDSLFQTTKLIKGSRLSKLSL